MPELPEVETIARRLRDGVEGAPSLIGMRITTFHLPWGRTLAEPSEDDLTQQLPGNEIIAIRRRGKYIVIQLKAGWLLIHLRMSGDLLVGPIDAQDDPYARFMVDFTSKWRLTFSDVRKFGRVWFLQDAQKVLGKLGPEPLADRFTKDALYRKLSTRKRKIKPLLMDQSFLAGLGNIYTDEALHLAKINPLVRADRLSEAHAHQLWRSIRKVLREGIRRQGASIDWVYRGGDYQKHLRVYQRTGEPCIVCGTPIRRMVVGQRGTHYCPLCQPLPQATSGE